jgi:hypothetical protein
MPSRLPRYGISANAASDTPATEPMVLMKNTRPAPASPADASPARSMATKTGFRADSATNGTASRRVAAAKLPASKSYRASGPNRTG